MAAGSDDDTDDEWRFTLEELDDDAEQVESGVTEDGTDDGNIAGTLAHNQPLEPGEIDLENALFVGVGILLVVGLIVATMFGL